MKPSSAKAKGRNFQNKVRELIMEYLDINVEGKLNRNNIIFHTNKYQQLVSKCKKYNDFIKKPKGYNERTD